MLFRSFRQSKATGSGIAAGTNIVAQGQGNQAGSITQSMGNIGGSRAPYCQKCGYSHYGIRMVRLHHPQLSRQLILLDQWLSLWAGESQIGVHSLV